MKRLLWIALGIAVPVLVWVLAVPVFLSSEFVKARLEEQLQDITGQRVRLSGASTVTSAPYLGMTFKDVAIGGDEDGPASVIVQVEKLRARIALIPALLGDAKLTSLRFVRPRFNFRIDESGNPNWLLKEGRLAESLTADEGGETANGPVGTVYIDDGRAVIEDEQNRRTTRISSINGQFDWPALDSPASLAGRAVWNGEIVGVEASTGNLIALLNGTEVPLSVKINSKPMAATFEGTSSGTEKRNFSGKATLSMTSLRRAMEWLGIANAQSSPATAVSLRGKLTGFLHKFEVQDATASVGEATGNGVVAVSWGIDERAKITGTMAFDKITVTGASVREAILNTSDPLRVSQLHSFDLDMRFSANEAVVGPVTLGGIAAALRTSEANASLDIGDATAFGGSVTARLDVGTSAGETGSDLAFSLKDVDFASIPALTRKGSAGLRGKGSMRVKLHSNGNNASDFVSRLNGEGEIRSGGGSLTNVSLEMIRLAGEDNKIPEQSGIWSGNTAFSNLNLSFFLANGVAFLRDTIIESQTATATLRGQIDLARQTLALEGEMQPVERATDGSVLTPPANLRFFVGGTLSSPLLMPVTTRPRP